jgi:hypothetical protein
MAPCNADGMEKKERRKSQIEVNIFQKIYEYKKKVLLYNFHIEA